MIHQFFHKIRIKLILVHYSANAFTLSVGKKLVDAKHCG